jgi:hypothetical protein
MLLSTTSLQRTANAEPKADAKLKPDRLMMSVGVNLLSIYLKKQLHALCKRLKHR